jgi:hypothetical protein
MFGTFSVICYLLIAGLMTGFSLCSVAGLLLRGEPPLNARAPVKNFATHMRSRGTRAKHFPAIERAHVSPQFGGEFFLR